MYTILVRKPIGPAAALAALLLLWYAAGASAAEPADHDIWLISTRSAPWSSPVGGEDRIRYWRLDASRNWAPASLDDFLAADDPTVPTCIFVHGNRVDRTWAVRDGWALDQKLKREAPGRPLRFVIWSWPAEQIPGLRQDVQVKAYRSDVQAHYLACVIGRMNPDVPLSLVGYSFGARTITGALELLAGGRIAGHKLAGAAAPLERKPVRAVLVAAALDADWLMPGRRDGRALNLAERVLVTRNLYDPALKWYDRMYGPRGPQAMGYTGPVGTSRLGDARKKLVTLPVEQSVGGNHDWGVYLSSKAIRSRLPWFAFLEPAEATAAQAATSAPAAQPSRSQAGLQGPALSAGSEASGE